MEINKMKIGARVLDKTSMKCLLPNYKNIFNQISEIRKNASELRGELNKSTKGKYREIIKREPEFIKHHNNVFSILGERGAGKTSVLLSLKHEIMQLNMGEIGDIIDGHEMREYVNDEVLPIVVPQDMESINNCLEWVIGFFKEIVRQVEKEYREDRNLFDYKRMSKEGYCQYDETSRQNVITNSFNRVEKSLILRKEHYKNLLLDMSSKKEYIEANTETLIEDIQLIRAFKEFIDEYIEYKKESKKQTSSIEPLIHVFFDDVDISTTKCTEVLETILRYLSHPNIVVFVGGNYKTFEETLVIDYLSKEGILDKELSDKSYVEGGESALKTKQILAYDHLKKILSPALRYNLRILAENEIADFKYNNMENQNNYKSLKKLIIDCFSLDENENFFTINYSNKNGENKNEIIGSYFSIFDNKPRGVINVYYYLNNIVNRVNTQRISSEEFWRGNIEEMERFLEIIIQSSSELNLLSEKIKEFIIFDKEKNKILPNESIIFSKEESDMNLRVLEVFIFIYNLYHKEDELEEKLKETLVEVLEEYLNQNVITKEVAGRASSIFPYFFKNDSVKNIMFLFYSLSKEYEVKKADGEELFYSYIDAIKKIEDITEDVNLSGVVNYLKKGFYKNRSKLERIINNIEKYKNKTEALVEKDRKIYFQNFYTLPEFKSYLLRSDLYSSFKDYEKLLKYDIGELKNRSELIDEKELIESRRNKSLLFKNNRIIKLKSLSGLIEEVTKKLTQEIEDYNFIQSNLDILDEVLNEIINRKTLNLRLDSMDSNLYDGRSMHYLGDDKTKQFKELIKNKISNYKYFGWTNKDLSLEIKNSMSCKGEKEKFEDLIEALKKSFQENIFPTLENLENVLKKVIDILKSKNPESYFSKYTKHYNDLKEVRIHLSIIIRNIEYSKVFGDDLGYDYNISLDEVYGRFYSYYEMMKKNNLLNSFELKKMSTQSKIESSIDELIDTIYEMEEKLKKDRNFLTLNNTHEILKIKNICGESILNENQFVNFELFSEKISEIMSKYNKMERYRNEAVGNEDFFSFSDTMKIEEEKDFLQDLSSKLKRITEDQKIDFKNHLEIYNSLSIVLHNKKGKEDSYLENLYNEIKKDSRLKFALSNRGN